MKGSFQPSRLKVERAKKHIEDLNTFLLDFAKSDFYRVGIDKNLEQRINFLTFEIDASPFPLHACALTIGDALHNLRSALDIMYYRIARNHTRWTKFPIADSREKLIAALKSALEQEQITASVHDFILNSIKPYKGGNYALWILNELNILDKHQLLIPVLQFMRFDKVRLEDNENTPINERVFYVMQESSRFKVVGSDGRDIAVKNQGEASAVILFDSGTVTVENEAVIPTLYGIAEEVSRTIDAFDLFSRN